MGDWDGYLATEPGVLDLCESSFGAFRRIGCRVERALPAYKPQDIWRLFLEWRWWAEPGSIDLYNDPKTREQMKPELIYEIENGIKLRAVDVTKAAEARNDWYAAVTKMFETY